MPAPTAAADPLDDPPGVRFESNGFLVGPDRLIANSVVTVLPRMTAPPRRSAATHAASCPDRHPRYNGEFIWVGMSAVPMMSLTATGQPSTGESGFPALYRRVAASALLRAAARLSVTKALTFLSRARITSMHCSRNSRGVDRRAEKSGSACEKDRTAGLCQVRTSGLTAGARRASPTC